MSENSNNSNNSNDSNDNNNGNEFLVDLFDEDGNKVTFEHLDTVDYKDKKYVVCIPYDDDEEEVEEIVIFEAVACAEDECDCGGEEECLEQVTDMDVMSAVYEIFKERNSDLFEFED